MGGHVDLRFVGWRWRETLHGSGFDQGYLREGGLDTEVESIFLMSPRQGETTQHSA